MACSLSVSHSVFIPLSLFPFVSLPLPFSFSLSFCLSSSVLLIFSLFLCLSISRFFCLPASLSIFVYLFFSVSLSLFHLFFAVVYSYSTLGLRFRFTNFSNKGKVFVKEFWYMIFFFLPAKMLGWKRLKLGIYNRQSKGVAEKYKAI